MSVAFGENVKKTADALAAEGKDANQIAKIVCDKDPDGHNYGIGIVLDDQGQPWPTSATVVNHLKTEIDSSLAGNYMSSAAMGLSLKEAVLRWQRIPEEHWDRFRLFTPSDAGTGAVMTSIEMALILYPDLNAIAAEKLSWPAYKAIAKTCRIGFAEHDIGSVMDQPGVLPVYQAGPMNTTGRVQPPEIMQARAQAASSSGSPVLLDRAYAGFEYARISDTTPYDQLMRMSYEAQIKPFIDSGVPFWISISPTKAFVTFALRPCGLVLMYIPDSSRDDEVTLTANTILRARGSSFEHPATRAFVSALVGDLPALEREHLAVIKRLAAAEKLWRHLSEGTPLADQFSDDYAGLFRNPQAGDGAQAVVYDAHLYPVFTPGRCRLNVTGIPSDEETARKHVSVFSDQVY